MIIYRGWLQRHKEDSKEDVRVGKSMSGGNKLRRGDLPTGESVVFPFGWQEETYIVALGRSWSTVTGQEIPSQVQAGGCWWVGTQEEWRRWESAACQWCLHQGAAVRWSQKWGQSRAHQGNVCIIGCPAVRRWEKRNRLYQNLDE